MNIHSLNTLLELAQKDLEELENKIIRINQKKQDEQSKLTMTKQILDEYKAHQMDQAKHNMHMYIFKNQNLFFEHLLGVIHQLNQALRQTANEHKILMKKWMTAKLKCKRLELAIQSQIKVKEVLMEKDELNQMQIYSNYCHFLKNKNIS